MTGTTEREIKLKATDWIEQFDHEFLAELIDAYLDDAQKRLAKMRAAIESCDTAACGLEAHTLKSSSANLGAADLSDLARQIETIARGGNLELVATAVQRWEEEFSRVKTILEMIRVTQTQCRKDDPGA